MFKLRDYISLRGNKRYISKIRCKIYVRKYIFNKRTVNTWNKLPNRIIYCNSIDEFKNNLDKLN